MHRTGMTVRWADHTTTKTQLPSRHDLARQIRSVPLDGAEVDKTRIDWFSFLPEGGQKVPISSTVRNDRYRARSCVRVRTIEVYC